MSAVERVQAGPVGRDEEVAVIGRFLATGAGPRGLLLRGGPGIGKSTLWEAGVAAARAGGWRVLSARASGAEARLAFAALIDLLDEVGDEELAPLPAPQRGALGAALLRAEPEGGPPEPRAIALGFLNAVRAAAARGRVLVAIDDIHWLDAPSRDALAFACRRLDTGVRFLLSRRPGPASPLEHALTTNVDLLEVGPLSLGAIRRLLVERLGLSLSRHLLRQLVASTLGNPLFALEVGRTLAEGDPPGVGEDLPVPDTVEDLLGTRVGRLPGPVRRLLLAVALSADLSAEQLGAIAGPVAVEEAVDAGLLVLEGDRVRVAHPLLGAAARKRSRPGLRRELHLELARVVADEGLRARHLALATAAPDDELAATVAAAAAAAAARGARQEAVELAEQALRLTPPGSPTRWERLLALAGHLETAGELQRVTDLLTPELSSMPSGSTRARAWLLLAEGGHIRTFDDNRRHLERALAEAQDDPVLRARVVAKMSSAVIGVERIHEAEAQAVEVLPDARAEPDAERLVLFALAWARGLRGRSVDEACERFAAASAAAGHLAASPERVAGQRLVWRGEVERARALFDRLLALADERGELASYAWGRLHLCELELRIGNWDAAERLLDEWAESSEGELLVLPMYERCRALLAAGRGVPDEAERWAREAIARAEAIGTEWERLEALRARGIAALLAHDPERTVESLRTVWEHTKREGVDEPGVFPVAADLVEALAEVGGLDEARAVIARLRRLSQQQDHPWGLVTAKRCAALVRLHSDADERAARALEEAASEYEALGLGFDAARSLLALGRTQRRRRQWGAARDTLERAAAAFDRLGSPGWAGETRAELARVGARRPQPSGELTPAERRVAELAADGLANKEIAQALFVSVKTVEGHLSHVYAKLGVRSRAQLARRLAAPG